MEVRSVSIFLECTRWVEREMSRLRRAASKKLVIGSKFDRASAGHQLRPPGLDPWIRSIDTKMLKMATTYAKTDILLSV
jgi:hypothetical protein